MKTIIVAAVAAVVALPTFAQSPSGPILSFSAGVGMVERDGNQLNSSFGPPTEIESNSAYDVDALAAVPFGGGFLVQGEIALRRADVDDTVLGFFPTDDTAERVSQYAVQVGHTRGDVYLGGFAAYNEVSFTPASVAQDASTWALGLNGAYHTPDWSFGAQFGGFSAEANNLEVLDNTVFLQLTATRFLDDGNTGLGAHLSLAAGQQDGDDVVPNDASVLAAGLHFEHGFDGMMIGGQPTFFAAIDWIGVSEDSTTGSTDRVHETQISVGFRVTFGSASVQDRTRRTAPEIADLARWQGLTPMVD